MGILVVLDQYAYPPGCSRTEGCRGQRTSRASHAPARVGDDNDKGDDDYNILTKIRSRRLFECLCVLFEYVSMCASMR